MSGEIIVNVLDRHKIKFCFVMQTAKFFYFLTKRFVLARRAAGQILLHQGHPLDAIELCLVTQDNPVFPRSFPVIG